MICATADSASFDALFVAFESAVEGFVTLADLELKERVGCAWAAFRVLPLFRRVGGMAGG